jgi:2-polyprenyl-6-methoxyphenol hydroxylase-like FAD-dependent oxidoreductase
MESWSRGRVALAGDAAYCPTPFTGQGTSLALIGAFVLARELTRTPKDHAAAFARCEARMRPFVCKNQDMVSLERREPIPDAIFDEAKNAIVIDDLLDARL